jgi:RecJ-like exonuclease
MTKQKPPCPECDGTGSSGHYEGTPCPTYHGSGLMPTQADIQREAFEQPECVTEAPEMPAPSLVRECPNTTAEGEVCGREYFMRCAYCGLDARGLTHDDCRDSEGCLEWYDPKQCVRCEISARLDEREADHSSYEQHLGL